MDLRIRYLLEMAVELSATKLSAAMLVLSVTILVNLSAVNTVTS